MNIHNKLWNWLLDLSIGFIILCSLDYDLKRVIFIFIPITIILIALSSMIVVFANSKMIIPKRLVEFDGFCKLVKLVIIIYLFQNTSLKFNISLYVLTIVIAIIDYLNRRKIYIIYAADMHIELFCEETNIEKKTKRSYKLAWLMFLGVIFTFLLKDSNSIFMFLTIVIIMLYESILSILLYIELRVLKVAMKKIIFCLIFFYLILMITSIFNIVGYGGVFVYLIMGGAIVPILNILKEV